MKEQVLSFQNISYQKLESPAKKALKTFLKSNLSVFPTFFSEIYIHRAGKFINTMGEVLHFCQQTINCLWCNG